MIAFVCSRAHTMFFHQDKMQRLARITRRDNAFLEVFWDNDHRQVIYKQASNSWLVTDDTKIVDGICRLIQRPELQSHHLVADNIMVFDQKEHHGRTYDHLVTDIYNCDWSDFACDGLVLHFNVQTCAALHNEAERLELAQLVN